MPGNAGFAIQNPIHHLVTEPMSPLDTLTIDLDALASDVSDKVWRRGQDYAQRGLVEIVAASPARVTAHAHGTETYTTAIERTGERLDLTCTCPAHADWPGPCKHLVALAIALASPDGQRQMTEGAGVDAKLRHHLAAQPHDALVDLVMEMAEAQPLLKQRLELQARAAEASPKELAALLRKAITSATRTRGFVDYRRMTDWAAGADTVIDQMEDTVRAGPSAARAVLDLVPYLVERLEKAVENCDDDGHIGALLQRCATLLEAAAEAARPDGQAFARLLIGLDLDSDYLDLEDPARRFADVLGAEGLKAYWREIETAWVALKPLRPGDKGADAHDTRRLHLTRRMLARAEAVGDVDARIEVLSRTLTWPGDYVRIAQLYKEDGRLSQAVSWIDEALWLFEDRPTPDLIEGAADILAAAGRHDRALDLLWGLFTRLPSLDSYKSLVGAATAAGGQGEWPRRALDWLEAARAGRPPKADQPEIYGRPAQARASDVLVAIHLHEGRLDAAWESAGTGTLSPGAWERLARASEAARPADAADVYERLAEQAVQTTMQKGYHEACGLVLRVQALRARTGQSDRFRSWVESLRAGYKRKRTFIAMLAETAPD